MNSIFYKRKKNCVKKKGRQNHHWNHSNSRTELKLKFLQSSEWPRRLIFHFSKYWKNQWILINIKVILVLSSKCFWQNIRILRERWFRLISSEGLQSLARTELAPSWRLPGVLMPKPLENYALMLKIKLQALPSKERCGSVTKKKYFNFFELAFYFILENEFLNFLVNKNFNYGYISINNYIV